MSTPLGPAPRSAPAGPVPREVWLPAGFFVAAGLLEFGVRVAEMPEIALVPVWQALGGGLMHVLLAAGLWLRLSVCRWIAIVYCLASLVVYLFALGLAYSQVAPVVRFPPSVVIGSLFQIPSCALLLPLLRSSRAVQVYHRPLPF